MRESVSVPSSRPRERFLDIVANIDHIFEYVQGLTFTDYAEDHKTRNAVERCLGRISEAAVKLSDAGVADAPDHEWQAIRAFGNRLRHEYDEVLDEIVWDIIKQDLKPLRQDCARIAEQLADDDTDQSR